MTGHVSVVLLLHVVLKGFVDIQAASTRHHWSTVKPDEQWTQKRQVTVTCRRWTDLCTCTARPVFVLGHRKRTCRLQSGFLSWLCICRGGREERRGEGGRSYVALWRAGFASLFPWQQLSYSIQPWDGLCIWKQFPVVSQALSLFSFSCFVFLFYCLRFKRQQHSSSLGGCTFKSQRRTSFASESELPLFPVQIPQDFKPGLVACAHLKYLGRLSVNMQLFSEKEEPEREEWVSEMRKALLLILQDHLVLFCNIYPQRQSK